MNSFLKEKVGTCVAADANPAATITWKKNGKPLVADGKTSGLSTTSSTLQYAASKEDNVSVFSCMSTHQLTNQEAELEPFPIHYPSEKVSLQVLSKGLIVEGDNVTLKCQADGNPPPSSFFFHMKGQKALVENLDTYTLTSISREAGGEYKCSLADNEKMESSQSIIVVSYLDLSLTPSGTVRKAIGDSFSVKVEQSASGEANVSWTKNGQEVRQPEFNRLTYADAGVYVCELSMPGLTRRRSFEMMVEGKPEITGLNKHRPDGASYKVLTCEATGVPEPSFHWSVNSTNEESSYINGKATHKIRVIPKLNLTVTCSVSNRLGDNSLTINVSSIFKEEKEEKGSKEKSEDQSKLIVGGVAGLLIAAAVVGLVYWLYMKNSRQGSWKTGEKEVGTSEESKTLEENHPTV
ncbi:CD166 antigen like A [Dissostichus eleginoides]|uniref:CD166 antigen like A n=1 Tax=Dissostichus eleginoides TaxID=100907 RepID=A0AAD9BHJ4_DISEL|nr:CD166 antigen like A [Dissostichus eleginoides]